MSLASGHSFIWDQVCSPFSNEMATYLKKKGKKKAYHLEFCFETSNLSSLHSQLLCWLLQPRGPAAGPPAGSTCSAGRAYCSSPALCHLGKGNTNMFKSIYGDTLWKKKKQCVYKWGSIRNPGCSSNQCEHFPSLQFLNLVNMLLCSLRLKNALLFKFTNNFIVFSIFLGQPFTRPWNFR